MSARDDASIAETLALARAAGVGRYGPAPEPPSSGRQPAQQDPSIDATLALARAAGIGRYGSQAADHTAPTPAQQHAPSDDDTLALLTAAGVGRFKATGAANATAPQAVFTPAAKPAPHPRAEAPIAQTPAAPSSSSAPASRTSKRQFVVLNVAQGGEAALAALESKMGMPFAVAREAGGAYWSEANSGAGGTQRAFSFMGDPSSLADLLGDLGSSALRLSMASVAISSFKAAGPGATGRDAGKEPPQLPQGLPKALRSALGRAAQ